MKIIDKLNAFIILFISILVLFGLSLINWTDLTKSESHKGGFIKDYSLFSELLPEDTAITDVNVFIDPALIRAQEQASKDKINDSISKEIAKGRFIDSAVIPVKAPISNGKVIVEDYTLAQDGLSKFKKALANRNNDVVRIGVIGDSYIEGDIFTQHIREFLQDKFGGNGVGFVALDYMTRNFRKSVKHNASGWEISLFGDKVNTNYFALPGIFCKTNGFATASYFGSTSLKHLENWNCSKFLFISPRSGSIDVNVGDGWKKHIISGSNKVQCIAINKSTNKFEIKTTPSSLIGLGVWLYDNSGITVDCMSLRGNSGITHAGVNKEIAHQMNNHIDYDLIIVEYGLNALTATRKDYTFYADYMVKVVNHLRSCYPNADILMLGGGDRGVKKGSEICSMATVANLIVSQREAARRAQCLFWDTREAMGGNNAIVSWCKNNDVNKDYIHLSTKGGERLAKIFVESLLNSINEK